MKIDITLEHHDLINHIHAYLAMQGLKPVGDIRFIRKKVAKGDPEKYEIRVECEGTDVPTTCPTCQQSRGQKRAATVTVDPAEASIDMSSTTTSIEEDEPVLDPDLGESTEPPEFEGSDPAEGDEDGGPSIMALVQKSNAIAAERERSDSKRRASRPARMSGESTRPPEGGK
jgi:hypothetical protein